uniref:Uncharacterized protein n=1 Tax=Ackermannviridae sp. TaxID=2831612 RepID=A0A8S5VM00_9CAUD|nr:MAG TPA: hypothetical protein [Ackermannviridae sp.]
MRNKTSTADRGAGINTAEHRGTARYTKRQPAISVRTIQGKKRCGLALPATGETGTA